MMKLPCFASNVQAGFPSPADDAIEQQLDLNALVVKHPAATFFVRVSGESMSGANIHSGDILVVDRALKRPEGKIVVALVDGEFTVKRFVRKEKECYLIAENPSCPPLKIDEGSDFRIWGVVTYVIHKAG